MSLYVIGLAAIVLALYSYLRQVYSTFSRAGIKSLPTVPLLGNMAGFIFQREHFYEHMLRLYDRIPSERFAGKYEFLRPALMVRDLEMVKRVLVKDFDHFVDRRSLVDSTIDPIFGRTVASMKGHEWKEMRSSLSPAFTSSKIKLMVPFMVDVGNQMIECLKEDIRNNGGHVEVNVQDLCNRFANDVIATCAFGTKINSHKDVDNYFYDVGKRTAYLSTLDILKILAYSSFPKVVTALNIGLSSEESKNFFRKLILTSMKTREEKNIVRNDMIHLLMEAKKGKLHHETSTNTDSDLSFTVAQEASTDKKIVQRDWSDDDLAAQAVTFFVAGFETVSTGMLWLLHELALNPDIQDRLYQEIKDIDAKNNGKFDYKSIQEMKYLDMVLSESFRKWPPVMWLERICTIDYNCGTPNDKVQKDFILRKGQSMNIPVWSLHRDPDYYPDPKKFDPERFSDENKHKIDPFTYMPFGLGPRNCIGARFALYETKVFAYTILRQLEVSPCDKTDLTEQLARNIGVSLRLKGGHWLQFKNRN